VFAGAVFQGLPLTILGARPAKAKEGGIPTRTFGKTGILLTVIGQGGARLALLRTREAARAHVQRAYSLGINYFDCAHSYWDGHSEEAYGDVLPAYRKQIFLTSKCTKRTRKEAEQELDLSLKRLRTDYLDLWQIHGVGNMAEVEQIFAPGGALEAFEAAKKAGKCRFFGFTGHEDPYVHLEMLKRYDKWDSILMPLHAADPAYLSFEKIVLPEAVKRGIGIQGMKNFGNSFLLRALSAGECLRYVLSLPVSCTAVGCSTDGQLVDDVAIAQSFKQLSVAEMDQLREFAKSARGAVTGPAMEYWKKTV
jgi:predicted aldo/keto reductase-like oxidoreductase